MSTEAEQGYRRGYRPAKGVDTPFVPATLKDNPMCNGCLACVDACPFDAFSVGQDKQGYYQPDIIADKCTDCGLCVRICPAVILPETHNTDSPTCYSFVTSDPDLLQASSSGGIFGVLAHEMFRRGGKVVGVAWEPDWSARFVMIDSEDEMPRLHKSKYLQPQADGIYRQVRDTLAGGVPVLFCGLPCHVSGLRAFLKKRYDNLVAVELLCSHAPSSKYFQQYVQEDWKQDNITAYEFRHKEPLDGFRCDAIAVRLPDGSTKRRTTVQQDLYQAMYHPKLMIGEHCLGCRFAGFPRGADLTIGDFWGIENQNPDQEFRNGISLVLSHNSRGQEFLDASTNGQSELVERPLPWMGGNGRGDLTTEAPFGTPAFHALFPHQGFRQSARKALRVQHDHKWDIGLVGASMAVNFGASLTYFALQSLLTQLGHTVLMIDRPMSAEAWDFAPEMYRRQPWFYRAPSFPTRQHMRQLNDYCDQFMVGSDQHWHPNLVRVWDQLTLLDFVAPDRKKIAVAASFGHDSFDASLATRQKMQDALSRFDALSFREASGVRLAEQEFGVRGDFVLDPVFCLGPDPFLELARPEIESTRGSSGLVSYFLNPSRAKADMAYRLARSLDLKPMFFSELEPIYSHDGLRRKWDVDVTRGTIEDRIASLATADFIITDSFHGMCFAVLLKKPFVAVTNKERGIARFQSIADLLNLHGRLVSEDAIKNVTSADPYLSIKDIQSSDKTLAKESERSIQWIRTALNTPIDNASQESRLWSQENRIIELDRKVASLSTHTNMLASFPALAAQYRLGDWLETIFPRRRDFCVVISVRDTPGLNVQNEDQQALSLFGLRQDLQHGHWCGYGAVIDAGQVIFESELQQNNTVQWRGNLFGHRIGLLSSPYPRWNISALLVDNEDYSPNKRGFNLIAIDRRTGRVIDSVAYDTHLPQGTAYRT